MDFFAKTHCDRCKGKLTGARTMSMFNLDCICMECARKERERDDYEDAVAADREAVKRGDYNFKGIGY